MKNSQVLNSLIIFILLVTFLTCKDDEPGVNIPNSDDCSYNLTLDTGIYNHDSDDAEFCSGGYACERENNEYFLIPYATLVKLGWSDATGLTVRIGGFNSSACEVEDYPTNSAFEEHLAPGSYDFSKDGIDGVEIHYSTPSGISWSSSRGEQSSSTFTILSSSSVTINNSFFVIVNAEFDCKLYNNDVARESIGRFELMFKNSKF